MAIVKKSGAWRPASRLPPIALFSLEFMGVLHIKIAFAAVLYLEEDARFFHDAPFAPGTRDLPAFQPPVGIGRTIPMRLFRTFLEFPTIHCNLPSYGSLPDLALPNFSLKK